MAPLLPPDHKSIPSGIDHVDPTTVGATAVVGALAVAAVAPHRPGIADVWNVASVQADPSVPEPENAHSEQREYTPVRAFSAGAVSGSSSSGDDLSWLGGNRRVVNEVGRRQQASYIYHVDTPPIAPIAWFAATSS